MATAALCVALFSMLATAAAVAPYPPSEPCSVSATVRGTDGADSWDVVGSGLGSIQPVRVALAATGQQVGAAQTDDGGNFRTVITAPADADSSAPDVTVSSPTRTCTSPQPGPPSTSGTAAPPTQAGPTGPARPTSNTSSSQAGGSATGPSGESGNGSTGSGSGTGSGTSGRAGSGSTGGTAGPSGSATPGSTTPPATSPSSLPSAPPLAEPLPGSDTPLGIGLGIAAVLLVLGTLAVLLLTRRPER